MHFHDDSAFVPFNCDFVLEHFGMAVRETPRTLGETPMGFILRSIFWLALAVVAVPPEARLGGGAGEVDMRDVDLGLELHDAAYGAWAFVAGAANACGTNPELCTAASDLVDTAVATATGLAGEVKKSLPPKAQAELETSATGLKKIQARVE
jgi:hypothetical protein